MQNERACQILNKYREVGLMDATIDDIKHGTKANGPYITRPSIREHRIKCSGISFKEAHAEIERGGIARVAYIVEYLMSPAEAVQFINEVGGKAVFAHPGELSSRTDNKGGDSISILNELLDELQPIGLFGLEAHYVNHTPEETALFIEIAKKRNLFITAGSDYHGNYTPKRPLKMPGMNYSDFKKLKKCL